MARSLSHYLATFGAALVAGVLQGQTLIVNEFSNGPEGSMEYIEMLVVPDGPVDPCTPTTSTCLDLRGWIIDDNNGYHGSGGVAQGAARFALHPLWSCVPLGTLIVIYNAEDPNPALPAVDISLTDGNCSLVIPSSNLTLFEYTNTTPPTAPCSYPGGWGTDPTPTWQSNLALANSGDCARISDAAGCMVFSLCYGNVSQNASVHFAGNGADKVWYFTTGDPFNTGAWLQGCAGDIATCGADDQTPGAANNAANAAWIGTFSSCASVVPVATLVASATASAACDCTGSALAEATGSIAPYTYAWYNEDWSTTGQAAATASALCGGTYHVIVTSGAGCRDTATVILPTLEAPNAGTNGTLALCNDAAAADLFDQLGGSPDDDGVWTPTIPGGSLFDPTTDDGGTYTYTVQGPPECPAAIATVEVTVHSVPIVSVDAVNEQCAGAGDGSITLSILPPAAYTVTWNAGLPDGPVRNNLSAGTYTATTTGAGGCSTTITALLVAPDALVLSTAATPALCGNDDGTACVTVSGGTQPYSISWNDPAGQSVACATALQAGTYSVTITDANGCESTASATVPGEASQITVTSTVVNLRCASDATGRIALEVTPAGEYDVAWSGPNGYSNNGTEIVGLAAGAYAYSITDPSGCGINGAETVTEPTVLLATASGQSTSCAGVCDGSITPAVLGGTAPYSYLVDQAQQALPLNDLCGGDHALTVVDAAGCTSMLNVTVPDGLIGVNPEVTGTDPLCVDAAPVPLTATPSGGTWSGAGVDNNGIFNPSIAGAGTHTISYALPCGTPASVAVQVLPIPNAAFTLPHDGSLLVRNTSTSFTSAAWYIDGILVSELLDLSLPTADAISGGQPLTICLAATNPIGCQDSTCALFAYPSEPSVHVPNAFSPNSDSYNDQFEVGWAGPEPSTFGMHIFDRWGKVVFASTDKDIHWDGTMNGTTVPIGVYAWRLEAMVQQESILLQGHVTLVR